MKNNSAVRSRKMLRPLLVLLIVISSCNKYLDKKSNSSLTVPSTLSDMQALLDDATLMNQQITPSFGEASSDECFLSDADYNSLSATSQAAYLWQFYPYEGVSDWGTCYRPVYNTNLVLNLIKNIPETANNQNDWNNVKGSALFFRSYYFLWLLWDYAKAYDSTTAGKDLGIALRLTSDPNVPTTRAVSQQCYDQIINDTKAAVPLLPSFPQHVFRPSKGAAYGLLARCYLSMRDYKDALLYADSCLQLNNQLMDFNSNNEFNGGITASYPFKQFNKETVFYTEMNLNYSTLTMTVLSPRIDTALYAEYDTNDLRLEAYYSLAGNGYPAFKGSYAGTYYLFTGIATDEMYLTRAECYIRLGEVEKGLNDLNSLLIARYKTGTYKASTSLAQQDALNLILKERKKELVQRTLRWSDIKRLNKENRNIVLKRVIGGKAYTLQPNTDYYALPLPDDIIKLTGIPQN